MDQTALYADVIFPLALQQLFTYSVPKNLHSKVKQGIRVEVQFGQKKNYAAIILKLHSNPPLHFKTKEIINVIDDEPIVTNLQIEFWNWIAEYYMCSAGEVMKAALPSGLKLESETYIIFNKLFTKFQNLTDSENSLLEYIQKKKHLRYVDLAKVKFQKNLLTIVKSLYEKDAIILDETLKPGFKPKEEIFIRFTREAQNENYLNKFADTLSKAKKQQNLIFEYIRLSGIFEKASSNEVKKKDLLESANSNNSILQKLIQRKIFENYTKDISRLEKFPIKTKEMPILTGPQLKALEEIEKALHSKETVLFHGVTSSGKTEIYIHLIQKEIDAGKQVLYLLPEIAVTSQIINRLRSYFGNKVGVYHSKFSDNERVEIWNNLNKRNSDSFRIILGVRSSVFLPFSDLGLIIVDEEHEPSFKQNDPAPRYHARDCATMLSRLYNAKTLLGTATPSIESYFNALNGKYILVELKERYRGLKLPEYKIINLRVARKKKPSNTFFSNELLGQIKNCLDQSKQVILFQNRRGFSTFIMCPECGWIPRCRQCDVTLTYHKHINKLVCHYCNSSQLLPDRCKKCGNEKLQTMGFGTEKLEEELSIYFPKAAIERMDLDSTRSKYSYDRIIKAFENRQIDILVGTQMITKGLDFDHVGVVGIINADLMFNFPDFRAFERSFQLILQAGGRAGRQNERGLVIVQTFDPGHPVIKFIVKNEFQKFYVTQLEERVQFIYPPAYRLIELKIRHRKVEICVDASNKLVKDLKEILGENVLGPDTPVVSKIQNFHLRVILVKIDRNKPISKLKQQISTVINTIIPIFKSLSISADVDPM